MGRSMAGTTGGASEVVEVRLYPVKGLQGITLADGAAVSPDGRLAHSSGVCDRDFMIVTETGGFVTQREIRAFATIRTELRDDALLLSNGESECAVPLNEPETPPKEVDIWGQSAMAHDMGNEVSRWLTAALGGWDGQPLRLVRGEKALRRVRDGEEQPFTSFADGYQMSVVSQESFEELSRRIVERGDDPVPNDRVRVNLTVKGVGEPNGEDYLDALSLPSGVVVKLQGMIARCEVPAIDQQTGDITREPTTTWAKYRRFDFGDGGPKPYFCNYATAVEGFGCRIQPGDPVEFHWKPRAEADSLRAARKM
jgi:uncharacterized protein YcbX